MAQRRFHGRIQMINETVCPAHYSKIKILPYGGTPSRILWLVCKESTFAYVPLNLHNTFCHYFIILHNLCCFSWSRGVFQVRDALTPETWKLATSWLPRA